MIPSIYYSDRNGSNEWYGPYVCILTIDWLMMTYYSDIIDLCVCVLSPWLQAKSLQMYLFIDDVVFYNDAVLMINQWMIFFHYYYSDEINVSNGVMMIGVFPTMMCGSDDDDDEVIDVDTMTGIDDDTTLLLFPTVFDDIYYDDDIY